jgi:hypothetical protein
LVLEVAYRGSKRAPAEKSDDPLHARYSETSSEELLDIVLRTPDEYTEDALAIARAVLAERGVDVDEKKIELDDEARAARERADRAEAERDDALSAMDRAMRDAGVCASCKKALPALERHVVARRPNPAGTIRVGDASITESAIVPLSIPLCAACDLRRPMPAEVGGGTMILAVFAGVLLSVAVAFALPAGLDRAFVKLLIVLPSAVAIGLMLLFASGRRSRRQRAALEIASLHAAFPMLKEGLGTFTHFIPAEDLGAPAIDALMTALSVTDARRRRAAEEQLVRISGSRVVAALRTKLDDPVASVHAVRALGRLRARDAAHEIRRVAESGPPEAREAAVAVLQSLE